MSRLGWFLAGIGIGTLCMAGSASLALALKRKVGAHEHPGHFNEIAARAMNNAGMPLRSDLRLDAASDDVYNLCQKYKIDLLDVITWATLPGSWDLDTYDAMLERHVKVYPMIDKFEIWNEADNANFRTGYLNAPYPEWFFRLYEVIEHSYRILKPLRKIVIAPCFMNWPDYDTYFDMAKLELGRYIDAVPVHPYDIMTSPVYWAQQLKLLKDAYHKPIWATEWGVPDQPSLSLPAYDQVDYFWKFMQSLGDFFDQIYWYGLIDDPGAGDYYGLLRSDLTPKPVYFSVKAYNEE